MSDIDTIRERHRPTRPDGYQECAHCLEPEPYGSPQPAPWPCDTRVVLDALEREGKLAFQRKHEARAAMSNADDARADVDRLAEALLGVKEGEMNGQPCYCPPTTKPHAPYCEAAREALRQYDEVVTVKRDTCPTCMGLGCGDCCQTGR